jgi:hypothetical protein
MTTITKAARKIIDCVLAGGRLCVCHTPTLRYSLEPRGEFVALKDAKAAIASGRLAPAGDGLFDATGSQTWVSAGGVNDRRY